MRRTKIVATLGPATSTEEGLRLLLEAGVDVFRLNFSHGARDSHRETIHRIRETSKELGMEVAILQDLCGPKIRTGQMEDGAVELVQDSEVVVTTRKVLGTSSRFSTSHKSLPVDVQTGQSILMDDGKLELTVLATSDEEVRCRVTRGGMLRDRKGMNLPQTVISTPSVTAKDFRDLSVGLEEGVDYVALSFVRHPDDILKVRRSLDKRGSQIKIIAKIEKPEALTHIDEILEVTDGIMVARGDLGIEMPIHQVPLLQKDLIRKANQADKIVITATQMLESMTQNAIPTRAEVADVANALIDGTDAVMLSGETAVGAYPGEAVATMDRILTSTESYLEEHRPDWDWGRLNPAHPVQDALGHAAHQLYNDLLVKSINAFTASGRTALFLSKGRPFAPIIAFTAKREVCRQLRLLWGVVPVLDTNVATADELRNLALAYAQEHHIAEYGERILLIAGSHFGQVGSANGIEVATLRKEEAQ